MIERTLDIATREGAMESFVVHPERGGPHPALVLRQAGGGTTLGTADRALSATARLNGGSAISGAQAYHHPPVRPDWLAQVHEDIIEPGLPIVDPHHHLWHDRAQGRYLLDELVADLSSGHNVVATVFLQCGWMQAPDGPEAFRPVRETEVVNLIAQLSATGAYGPARACAGIVAFADLREDALDAVLDAHQEEDPTHRLRSRRRAEWPTPPPTAMTGGMSPPKPRA